MDGRRPNIFFLGCTGGTFNQGIRRGEGTHRKTIGLDAALLAAGTRTQHRYKFRFVTRSVLGSDMMKHGIAFIGKIFFLTYCVLAY